MIEPAVIKEQELAMLIESVEKNLEYCSTVATYNKHELLVILLGKLYNLANDRANTNIVPDKNQVKVRKMTKYYEIKHL